MHRVLDGVRRVEAHVPLVEAERILDAVHHVANADDAGERNPVEKLTHLVMLAVCSLQFAVRSSQFAVRSSQFAVRGCGRSLSGLWSWLLNCQLQTANCRLET